MEEEFVNYEEALALKELGIDIEYLMDFDLNNKTSLLDPDITSYRNEEDRVGAPLYQQAFKWFRDKHNLCNRFIYLVDVVLFEIVDKDGRVRSQSQRVSYEKADLEALKKLIELVKK